MKVSAMLLGSLVIFGAAASAQEERPLPLRSWAPATRTRA